MSEKIEEMGSVGISSLREEAFPCQAETDREPSGVAAAWRRGLRHAVERLDQVLSVPHPRKGRDALMLDAVRRTLAEVYALSEAHYPTSYNEAFAICSADLDAACAEPVQTRATGRVADPSPTRGNGG